MAVRSRGQGTGTGARSTNRRARRDGGTVIEAQGLTWGAPIRFPSQTCASSGFHHLIQARDQVQTYNSPVPNPTVCRCRSLFQEIRMRCSHTARGSRALWRVLQFSIHSWIILEILPVGAHKRDKIGSRMARMVRFLEFLVGCAGLCAGVVRIMASALVHREKRPWLLRNNFGDEGVCGLFPVPVGRLIIEEDE
jgi:hypothetical protein